ncbi:MAG: short-chain fatty acid transporter [Oscillospiraceae bacterium]|nr:short-chain fatty acid transporter [Oscillospiraceae bacterium]
MFKKITNGCVNLVNRLLPDAFIFCIILTIIVFVAAMPATSQGPVAMMVHWGKGAWSLLGFSMQMALVLVLGNAFATAPAIKNGLTRLAAIPKNPTSAIILVTAVSTICCWLNWGFGLVVGAIFAKEIAKRRRDTDYRLLIASAYSGFVVWHAGLSGSIPLDIATLTDAVVAKTGGTLEASVPISETILSGWNLLICLAILIIMPLVNAKMHPAKDEVIAIDPALLVDEEPLKGPAGKKTPAQAMEGSVILSIIVFALGLGYTIYWFAKGNSLDLNSVNLIFLWLGILFHKTPINYVRAIDDAVKGAGGVILQFPFYAGIMGMMTGANPDTGASLAGVISNGFVAISTPVTFPLFAFLSAGIVNFFVPSGGGQWTVQGPIIMPAGVAIGVKPAISAMGIAWGDAWTNLLQPFWALPALGIAKLSARDIMGYCLVDLIVTGIIICVGFVIVGLTGISAIV